MNHSGFRTKTYHQRLVEWRFRGSMAAKSMVKDVLIGYGKYWRSWFSSQCELVPQPVIFFPFTQSGMWFDDVMMC